MLPQVPEHANKTVRATVQRKVPKILENMNDEVANLLESPMFTTQRLRLIGPRERSMLAKHDQSHDSAHQKDTPSLNLAVGVDTKDPPMSAPFTSHIQRASSPIKHLRAFRPVSHPFICQRAYCGDGLPCPYQQECANCEEGTECSRKRDVCSTSLNNSHDIGNFLGPDRDIKVLGTLVLDKKTRTGVKDYFGRNKKNSNMINFEQTQFCRKCYQNMSYEGQADPERDWPRLKSEIIHIVLTHVEKQQIDATGYPGVYTIALKKSEEDRVDEYINSGMSITGTTYAGGLRTSKKQFGVDNQLMVGTTEQPRSRTTSKMNKTAREQKEGSYQAPLKILLQLRTNFCGYNKSVVDCHAINTWCREKLECGEIDQLPLWEHIPMWIGHPDMKTHKLKVKVPAQNDLTPPRKVAQNADPKREADGNHGHVHKLVHRPSGKSQLVVKDRLTALEGDFPKQMEPRNIPRKRSMLAAFLSEPSPSRQKKKRQTKE
jgi:hypothetical protein